MEALDELHRLARVVFAPCKNKIVLEGDGSPSTMTPIEGFRFYARLYWYGVKLHNGITNLEDPLPEPQDCAPDTFEFVGKCFLIAFGIECVVKPLEEKDKPIFESLGRIQLHLGFGDDIFKCWIEDKGANVSIRFKIPELNIPCHGPF